MCEDAKQIKGVNWSQLVSWIIPIFVAILVIVVNNYIATSTGLESRVRANELDIKELKTELIDERVHTQEKIDQILQDNKEIKKMAQDNNEMLHNVDKRLFSIEQRYGKNNKNP